MRPGAVLGAVLAVALLAPVSSEARATQSAVTPDKGQSTVPRLALDPRDPRRMAVAYDDTHGCALATTVDAGRTWWARNLGRGKVPGCGDATVAYGPGGTLYLAYRLRSSFDDLTRADATSAFVARTRDQGRTWSTPTAVGSPAFFSNAPELAVDPIRGTVHLIRLDVTGTCALVPVFFVGILVGCGVSYRVVVASSDDGGATFRTSQPLPPEAVATELYPSVQAIPRAVGAVGPDGTLHVAWSRLSNGPLTYSTTLYTSRSTDGGRTFHAAVPVGLAPRGCEDPHQPECHAAYALRTGAGGAVHLAWLAGEPKRVKLSSSRDGGASWRTTTLPAYGRELQTPALGVAGRSVDVAYLSHNRGEVMQLWLTSSTDGGRTFTRTTPVAQQRGPDVAPGASVAVASLPSAARLVWERWRWQRRPETEPVSQLRYTEVRR